MSQPSWEDIVELPDELDDETAGELRANAAEIQDTTGEVCPYPQVEAKVWQSGDGLYRISLQEV
jgi:hypothetical protein